MRKIILLVITLLLLSCGVRNAKTDINKKSVDSSALSKKEIVSKAKIKEETFEIKDFNAENFHLDITPNEKDTIVRTQYIYLTDKKGNSAKIPVKTNSKINFGSQNVSNKETLKQIKQIDSLTKRNEFLEVKIKATEKIKNKQTEKKAPGFWTQVFGILGFSIVVIFLWEMFKKNFVSIFNRILLLIKLPFGKFKD